MGSDGYQRMKKFYEESDIGHQLAAPLKEGTRAVVEFVGDQQLYGMEKVKGRTVLTPGKPEKAEIYFKFSEGSIDYLFNPPADDAADYINRLCDCLLEKDPNKKVELKLLTSVVDGWRKGYIAMMMLGGPRAVSTIAKIGIKIPARFLRTEKSEHEENEKI